MNLLIIDDDSICSFVNTRVAQRSGIFSDIHSVHNGKDALDIFREAAKGTIAAPDMVLLDLNMPVMNGFEFIEALKTLNFPKKEMLSIVILTSSDNAIDMDRARAMGIRHYIVKSLTLKDLQTTIFSLYSEAQNLLKNGNNGLNPDSPI